MPSNPRNPTDSERTAGTAQALQPLADKLQHGTPHIGIYGLGYVGLPPRKNVPDPFLDPFIPPFCYRQPLSAVPARNAPQITPKQPPELPTRKA